MTYKGIFEEAMQLEKWKKKAQEAEGELSIVKTTSITNSPEMRNAQSEIAALKQQLHIDRERYKEENNDLYNRIAEALEVNEAHQKLNGDLRKDMDLLREDNQCLSIENGRMMKKLAQ